VYNNRQATLSITTNHSNLDLELVAKHAKVVFDTRDAMRGIEGDADVQRL